MILNNSWTILIVLFCAFSAVHSSVVGHAARVLELSDRFLEVRKDGVWLVKFYAPWCGHCKRLEPIFNHVAQALHDTNIRVSKVDCTRFPSVASEFGVRGFPTIMFIHGDRISTYNGERITEDIVDYAKKMNGPHVMNTTLDPSEIDGIFFGYTGSNIHTLWDEYEAVAKENQDTDRYYYFTQLVNEGNSTPPRVIHKKSNGAIISHKEGIQLKDFVTANRFDSYVRMTRSNFHRLIQTKKWIVMSVIDEDKIGRSASHHISFRDMVGSLVGVIDYEKFQLCWTSAVDFMTKFTTVELEPPYLLVINSSNYEHYFLHEGEEGWSTQKILNYLEDVSQGGGTAYGGNTLLVRMYRTYYELKINLLEMWLGNPVLTTVLFGLPLGFLSLIVYSICCADFMDEDETVAEGEDQTNHEKHD